MTSEHLRDLTLDPAPDVDDFFYFVKASTSETPTNRRARIDSLPFALASQISAEAAARIAGDAAEAAARSVADASEASARSTADAALSAAIAAETARAEAAEAAIALTPWTTDVDAASHRLHNLSELQFASTPLPMVGTSGFVSGQPQFNSNDDTHRAGFSVNWFPLPLDFTQFADAYIEAWGTAGGVVQAVQYAEAQALDGAYAYGDFFVEAGGPNQFSVLTLGDNAGQSTFLRDHGVTTLGPMNEVTGPSGVPSMHFGTATPYFGEPGWYSQYPTTTAFEHWGGSLSGAAAGEALWLYPEGSRVEHQWFAQSDPATFGFMEAQALASGSFFSAERWTSSTRQRYAKLIADAASARVEGIDEYQFSNGAKLVQRSSGGVYLRDDTSAQDGHAKLIEFWTAPDASGDLADTSVNAYRIGPTSADDKTGEMYLEALDGATGHYPYVDIGAQSGPVTNYSFMELSNWDGSLAHFQFLHDVAAGLNQLRSDHLQLLESPSNVLAFFGTTPTVGQHAAIAAADGTLVDVTSKLNTVLQYLRDLGLVHA